MTHPLRASLQEGVRALGLPLTDAQQDQLLAYLDLLIQWNRVYNLTALRDPALMLTHHIFDSLSVIAPLRRYTELAAKRMRGLLPSPLVGEGQGVRGWLPQGTQSSPAPHPPPAPRFALPNPLPQGERESTPYATSPARGKATRLLDVGSGGGLPGVVIAICQPEVAVTCVDAVAKKAAFIQQAAGVLRLSNLAGQHARVESLAGPFDIITSRAFASLADFAAASRGALAEGGVWLAMKGKRPDAEIAELPPSVAVFHVEQLTVPRLDAERCLVWMRPRMRR